MLMKNTSRKEIKKTPESSKQYRWTFGEATLLEMKASSADRFKSVSYTHLDVYKRQVYYLNVQGTIQ